jgi:hypothetical protein
MKPALHQKRRSEELIHLSHAGTHARMREDARAFARAPTRAQLGLGVKV